MARRARRRPEGEFPPRLALFGQPSGWALRCPSVLFGLLSVPLAFFTMMGGIFGLVKLFYGFSDDGLPGLLWFLGVPSAPGGLLWLLYLAGRLELVDTLPDASRHAVERGPATLALPGGPPDQPLRPVSAAPPPVPMRRSAEGLLSVAGAASLALALALAVIEQDSFGTVLGINLGGIRFGGTYWNRWWFVFYFFAWGGAASLAAGFLLLVRRLNRGGGDRGP